MAGGEGDEDENELEVITKNETKKEEEDDIDPANNKEDDIEEELEVIKKNEEIDIKDEPKVPKTDVPDENQIEHKEDVSPEDIVNETPAPLTDFKSNRTFTVKLTIPEGKLHKLDIQSVDDDKDKNLYTKDVPDNLLGEMFNKPKTLASAVFGSNAGHDGPGSTARSVFWGSKPPATPENKAPGSPGMREQFSSTAKNVFSGWTKTPSGPEKEKKTKSWAQSVGLSNPSEIGAINGGLTIKKKKHHRKRRSFKKNRKY